MLSAFLTKYWQWFVGGAFACIVGAVQLRLYLHQTRESHLKIKELEAKLKKEGESFALTGGNLPSGVTVQPNFDGFSYKELIQESWELTVILNDGRSWVDSNREHLQTRFADQRRTTRFCFIHPDSSYVDVLIQKNGKSKSTQIEEIFRSIRIILENKTTSPNVEVRAHRKPAPYCLFLTEKVAIVHPYLFFEAGGLPMFAFANGTPFYAIYRDDARKLLKEAMRLDRSAMDRQLKAKH